MLSSCMRCQVILHFFAAFRHSPASSLSTKGAKDYRIEYPTLRRLSSAWMTFVWSWMTSVRRAVIMRFSEGCPNPISHSPRRKSNLDDTLFLSVHSSGYSPQSQENRAHKLSEAMNGRSEIP